MRPGRRPRPGRTWAWRACAPRWTAARRSGAGVCLVIETTALGPGARVRLPCGGGRLPSACARRTRSRTCSCPDHPGLRWATTPRDRGAPRTRPAAARARHRHEPGRARTGGDRAARGPGRAHRWGLDGDGGPTTDAAAILESHNLLPMGGHKGAGLALMMELLTGALGGSLLSHEIVGTDASGLDSGASKLFVASTSAPSATGRDSPIVSNIWPRTCGRRRRAWGAIAGRAGMADPRRLRAGRDSRAPRCHRRARGRRPSELKEG